MATQSTKASVSRPKFEEEKQTLVFDLHGTLICLTSKRPTKDKSSYVEIYDQDSVLFYVIKRPGLVDFIKEMSKLFNICIHTSKERKLSEDVVEAIGLTPYVYALYTREDCFRIADGIYMKSLVKLNMPLSSTIFIDNSPRQTRSQPLNSILIHSFKGDTSDCALSYLSPFLRYMATLNDVRPVTEKLFVYYEQNAPEPSIQQKIPSLILEGIESERKSKPFLKEEQGEEKLPRKTSNSKLQTEIKIQFDTPILRGLSEELNAK